MPLEDAEGQRGLSKIGGGETAEGQRGPSKHLDGTTGDDTNEGDAADAQPTEEVESFAYDLTHTRAAVEGDIEALCQREKQFNEIVQSDRVALDRAAGAFKLYCGSISCFDPVSQRSAAAFRAVCKDDVPALKAELAATPELLELARNRGGQTLLEVAQERRCTRVEQVLLGIELATHESLPHPAAGEGCAMEAPHAEERRALSEDVIDAREEPSAEEAPQPSPGEERDHPEQPARVPIDT
jgi:hypothetical protein